MRKRVYTCEKERKAENNKNIERNCRVVRKRTKLTKEVKKERRNMNGENKGKAC